MPLTDPDRLFPVEPRLRDLARALSGGCRRSVVDQSGDISGEVDLF